MSGSEDFKGIGPDTNEAGNPAFNYLAWMSRTYVARCAASGNPIPPAEVKGLSTIVKRSQAAPQTAERVSYNKPNDLDVFLVGSISSQTL